MGSIKGVKSTHAGWRGNDEVVVVEFNPNEVNYETLLDAAQEFKCASKVFTHNPRQQKIASDKIGSKAIPVDVGMKPVKLSEQQYYLRNSPYQHLPLTELQATKINASLYRKKTIKQRPEDWLTNEQVGLLKAIMNFKKQKKFDTSLVWPDDDSKLLAYREKLLKHLTSLGAL